MLTIHYPHSTSYTENTKYSRSAKKPVSTLKNGVADLIQKLSQSKSWGDRQEAARILGEMKIEEAVPEITAALLKDPFWMVRYSAVQALVLIGDKKALPSLSRASRKDRYQVVRSFAQKAISKISEL